MAAELGVHHNTYARWERGERDPGATDLVPLAEQGWNINWLLTGSGPERLDQAASLRVRDSGDTTYGPAPQVDIERLRLALQVSQEELGGRVLPPDKWAELVSIIYELIEEDLPQATIRRIARAAA